MPRSAQLLPILALVVAVATAAWTTRQLKKARPMRAVASAVHDVAEPDDLVILTPHLLHAEVGLFRPLAAIAADRLPTNVERFARVFVVRRSERPPNLVHRMLESRARLLWSTEVEPYTIELFQFSEPERAVDDLTALLPTAEVSVHYDDGRVVECPWDGTRHQCFDVPWLYTGATSGVFDTHPLRCVWTHPIDDATIRIAYPHVEGATHVTGWHGMTDQALQHPSGGRVSFVVRAGSAQRRFGNRSGRGRRPITFSLPDGYEGPLRLELSATSAGARHFCWDLQTVIRSGAGGA